MNMILYSLCLQNGSVTNDYLNQDLDYFTDKWWHLHKQKSYKTCSCFGRDTWHIESKKFLQPPNYLIIIVNRITYSNNRFTKNKSRIPLDLYIKLGPYKFSLQASVDHHGYSMNSGHYTASINCCGKTFYCNDNKITECNITDTYNSSTAYILLYKLMLC